MLINSMLMNEWTNYKAAYQRIYDTPHDREHFYYFIKNLDYIHVHNSRPGSFKMGFNQFTDWSTKQIEEMTQRNQLQDFGDRRIFSLPVSREIPAKVDWRPVGAVTPVQNHSDGNRCSWAFAAIGALEGQLFRETGELVPLSAHNLIDISRKGTRGCAGGSTRTAFNYTATDGILSEHDYVYATIDRQSQTGAKRITCSGYASIKPGDELQLKIAVATIGPIAAAIRCSAHAFVSYAHGVYVDPTVGETITHAVLVVGYGTDEHGREYWLVKNSWGTNWGEDGYIRMARNWNNMCGIASEACYPLNVHIVGDSTVSACTIT